MGPGKIRIEPKMEPKQAPATEILLHETSIEEGKGLLFYKPIYKISSQRL